MRSWPRLWPGRNLKEGT
uniref:Uncharacterized protein n=1 Tax=Rhizophora mucronata TaxID=61149 RepID=A0A2P2NND7_RHIMU